MADRSSLRIGIALSGGGVRAAVFHLGVLARLAADNLLDRVTYISTVSGGSMVTGLVYGLGGKRWPTSDIYLSAVFPEARARLTQTSLQKNYIWRSLRKPWLLLGGRASVVSESMQECWGMSGALRDIPDEPRWIINATTYETGKNWRFTPGRMGDYVTGYVIRPEIPLADAVAASAAFPGLIGPLVLRTGSYSWSQFDRAGKLVPTTPPPVRQLSLWDGGVYDNLGVEPLFKQRGLLAPYRDEYNFLIVSDASGRLPEVAPAIPLQRPKRLVDIPMDQVRGLRARAIVDHFERAPGTGVYLRMGGSARYILDRSDLDAAEVDRVIASCLSDDDAALASAEGTHLNQVSHAVFDRLCRHGWEVASCTLASRARSIFDHQPWKLG